MVSADVPWRFGFAAASACSIDGLPPAFSGTVLAVLLNDAADPALLAPTANAQPYRGAPRHPVLGVRPPNSLQFSDDARWTVPEPGQAVQTGASLGMLIGRPAVRVPPAQALRHVAAWVLCNDGSWPVPNHYRPGLRWRARDGLCVVAPQVWTPRSQAQPDEADDPANFMLQLSVDGQVSWQRPAAGRVRSAAQLLADVSAFMTLHPGDLLLLGPALPAPLLRAGQSAELQLHAEGREPLRLHTRVELAGTLP